MPVQLATNDLPGDVSWILRRVGLTEYSECRSWIFSTRAAIAFHARRCAS
jgi:hypothetical protein